MSRFLIEVPHSPEAFACAEIVRVFLASGSHFLTNADWGCMDDQHCAWFVADVDTRADALAIVPPAFRHQARIVGLNRFSMDQVDRIMSTHVGSAPDRGHERELPL